jgi:hypothetical protein
VPPGIAVWIGPQMLGIGCRARASQVWQLPRRSKLFSAQLLLVPKATPSRWPFPCAADRRNGVLVAETQQQARP